MDNHLAQEIKDNGYVIVRNLLSKEKISQLRSLVQQHFRNKGVYANAGLTQPNAAVTVPEISQVFYDDEVLAILRQVFAQEEIMFTSHCDLHCRTLSNWHKDDGMTVMEGGYFEEATYQNPDCQVYKVALYLQDHYHNTGGLTVRPGSHNFSSVNEGEEVYLKTRAGDAIIFDVRLTHRGQKEVVPLPHLRKPINILQKVLKKTLNIKPSTSDQYLKAIYEKLSGDRLSIFFTYGIPNEYTKKFAINNMKRQIQQNKNTNIFLNSSIRQTFIDKNVLLAEDYFTDLVEEPHPIH